MRYRSTALFLVFSLCLVFVLGCGDGRPKRYPVRGVVTVDGKPLSGEFVGSVRLIPVAGGRSVQAQLDSEGKFTLGCYDSDDGCPLGEYKVEVNVSEQKNAKMRYLVPPRYWRHDTSGLVVKIEGEKQNLTIDVPWLPQDAKYRKMVINMNE
ncbi:MAG: hypothetical protein Q4D38_03870 [Planctomycetia bacterium]|nr:hypothetical protein [Planctomycetia bacterium]